MTTIHISKVDAMTVEVGDHIDQGGAIFDVVAIERDERSSQREVLRIWATWSEGIGDFFMSRTTGEYVASFRWELPAHMSNVVENRTGQKLNDGSPK